MTDEIVDLVLIPRERIAVLIGPKGTVKRKIERMCDVKISIDSESGEVSVLRKTSGDINLALKAQDITKAIARGFSPQKAYKLAEPNIYLELIDLTEYVTDKSLERVRARLIGRGGKARKYLSELTKAEISVYGKTVGIIGDADSVELAKEAVTRIIGGKPHTAVFRYVERHKD